MRRPSGRPGRPAQPKEIGHLLPNESAGVFDFLGTRGLWLFGDETIQVHQANAMVDDLWRDVGGEREINDSAHRRIRQILDANSEGPSSCAGH